MPTSAKRLGLDVRDDLELEQRLRRIEIQLEKKADLSAFSEDGSTDTQRVDTIPRVTGLRVAGSTPGAITVAWSQVRISDLRRYELDIAEDLAFATNAETKNLAGTEFTYSTNSDTGGGGDTSIFVRVRARSITGNVGAYSIVLNATTGQAQPDDIADDAVSGDKIVDGSITVNELSTTIVEQAPERGFISGLLMSNNAATKLDISVGAARDTLDTQLSKLTATVTKQINAPWVVGDDVGGFPSDLTLTADTWYRVFLLGIIDAASSAEIGFDTDSVATNLLSDAAAAGFTTFRQIGWVLTDSGLDILGFYQDPNDPSYIRWDTAVKDFAHTSFSSSARTETAQAAPDTDLIGVFTGAFKGGITARNQVRFSPTAAPDIAVAPTNVDLDISSSAGDVDSANFSKTLRVHVDASSQWNHRWASSSAGGNTIRYQVFADGFRYGRGQE